MLAGDTVHEVATARVDPVRSDADQDIGDQAYCMRSVRGGAISRMHEYSPIGVYLRCTIGGPHPISSTVTVNPRFDLPISSRASVSGPPGREWWTGERWKVLSLNISHKKIVLPRLVALTAIGGAILFFGYDLVADALFEGEFGSPHFIIETCVFIGVSWALVVGMGDLSRLRTRLDREQRRNTLLSRALAESIDAQMSEWKLSRSEKHVAWLIIKGYRFSEIARLRGVKEATTRLQASALYAKAGVSGRAEFVAEIIQPLLSSAPGISSSSDSESTDREEAD